MKRFLIVLLVNAERYWNQWGKVDVRDDVTVHDADVEHRVTRMLATECTPLFLQESSSIKESERASERKELLIPRKAVQLGLLPEPVAAAEDRMGELAMVEPGRTVLWVRGHQPSRARR